MRGGGEKRAKSGKRKKRRFARLKQRAAIADDRERSNVRGGNMSEGHWMRGGKSKRRKRKELSVTRYLGKCLALHQLNCAKQVYRRHAEKTSKKRHTKRKKPRSVG